MSAIISRSVRASVNASYENVEKVVNAPRNPIVIGITVVSDQPRSTPNAKEAKEK